jgi:hypothetical protein
MDPCRICKSKNYTKTIVLFILFVKYLSLLCFDISLLFSGCERGWEEPAIYFTSWIKTLPRKQHTNVAHLSWEINIAVCVVRVHHHCS